MQEYMGNAINVSLVEDDDGKVRTLRAVAEVVVLVSETIFRADGAGQMIRQREVGQFRFGATIKSMRQLIKHLGDYADEMEEIEERYVEKSSITPADKT
jgi:hypothetical protein